MVLFNLLNGGEGAVAAFLTVEGNYYARRYGANPVFVVLDFLWYSDLHTQPRKLIRSQWTLSPGPSGGKSCRAQVGCALDDVVGMRLRTAYSTRTPNRIASTTPNATGSRMSFFTSHRK